MTGGIRVGPVILDGSDYGQKRGATIAPEQLAKMKSDAQLIFAARDMLSDHKENVRLLSLVIHDLQGRVEGGKLAALQQCLDRSKASVAKAEGRS